MQTSDIEIYDKIPAHFSPQVEVAACYLEIEGKILLLQRAEGKTEPKKWGVPAGKLEKDEMAVNAAKRELFEETGIQLPINSSYIRYIGPLYICRPSGHFVYHSFKVELLGIKNFPEVVLSDEHISYKWASTEDLKTMTLIPGALEALERYYAFAAKKRTGAIVSTYLILQQGTHVLLGLRKNTGYNDGKWSLVAGHVEDDEPATTAMIREAKEEIGIAISPENLRVAHIMHRKSNRLNIDIFFVCTSWQGKPYHVLSGLVNLEGHHKDSSLKDPSSTILRQYGPPHDRSHLSPSESPQNSPNLAERGIENREPEKCEQLQFFALDALPANIVDYNIYALEAVGRGEVYSEHGFS